MGRSWRDGGEEGQMGFWKDEKTKASDWGCLPIDGFLTWALRRRRTDVDRVRQLLLLLELSEGTGVAGYGEEWKRKL